MKSPPPSVLPTGPPPTDDAPNIPRKDQTNDWAKSWVRLRWPPEASSMADAKAMTQACLGPTGPRRKGPRCVLHGIEDLDDGATPPGTRLVWRARPMPRWRS